MQPEIELFRAIHLGAKSPILDGLSLLLSWSALGWFPPLIAILFAFHPKTKPFTAPILISALLGGLVGVHLIKRALPRPRPSQLSFAQPLESHRESSFPSGHTTIAFCTATSALLVARRQKLSPAIGPIAIVWATGVGWSRTYRGVHWPSDVLAGACLGIASALLVSLLLGLFNKKH